MNIQFFAGEGKEKDNIKALRENRAEKVEELKLLYATLKAEERAITDDEEKRAETLNDEIKRIDKTIHILHQRITFVSQLFMNICQVSTIHHHACLFTLQLFYLDI